MTPPLTRIVVGLLVVVASLACEGERDNGSGDQRVVPPARRAPTVVFATGEGDEIAVRVTIARTPEERRRGLMYVERLAPEHGMLFLMDPPEREHSFWMKNTLIPLDLIFINARFEVVGIVANAEPLTLSSRRVDGASSYVLEVNGGWAAARQIGPGTRVRFENVF